MLSVSIAVLALAALAVALPFLFGRLLPEGTAWLLMNAVLSAGALMVAAVLYFVFAYAGRVSAVPEVPGAAAHFLRLGAMSAMIWLPVLVLALTAQPGRWKEKVW